MVKTDRILRGCLCSVLCALFIASLATILHCSMLVVWSICLAIAFVIDLSRFIYRRHKYTICGALLGVLSVLGAMVYPITKHRPFNQFCRKLYVKCGSYIAVYRIVKLRYMNEVASRDSEERDK